MKAQHRNSRPGDVRGISSRIIKFSDSLERFACRAAVAFTGLMLMCILLQIVARYLFNEPPAWTEELARHAMIWAGFLGATVACRRRLDPVLTNHANLRNPLLRQAARWLELAAVVVFCSAILLATPRFLQLHADRLTESLQLPSVVIVIIIPICMALILFQAVARVLHERQLELGKEGEPS